MSRLNCLALLLAAACLIALPGVLAADTISGTYLEARTCQVYTGPCFANGEVGLAGKEAIMAWNIEDGQYQGVDLKGLNVIVVVHSSDTLGFFKMKDAKQIKSIILVDERANDRQREALENFARKHAGRAGTSVARVASMPIEMSLDTLELKGELKAGKEVKLVTRKAHPGDCICSNESAYYPPLATVDNFAPGVALEGSFQGRGLGSRWTIPDSRSAYMGTFTY